MEKRNQMKSPGMARAQFYQLLPALFVILVSFALSGLIWLVLSPQSQIRSSKHDGLEKTSLFATNYPANGSFQQELVQLKNNKTLKENDEFEIHKSLLSTSEYLEIPPSLFWCLLFQESRLNHLDGIEGEKPTLGLGQFSRFSFYEINHQLDRYSSDNSNLIHFFFGRDIRPIAAKNKDLLSPSSYYSIPTAVVSSGLYFSNRYKHLTKLLSQKNLTYNPDIIWLFSAMAYNKGTRSVLSLWNLVYRKQGIEALSLLLNDYNFFQETTQDANLMTKSLKYIWDESKAKSYGKELRVHTKNITACSVSPLFQPTRTLTEISQ